MNARIAPLGASRYDHLHGDEHLAPELTAADQRAIAVRAAELITTRLMEGPDFLDIMDGLDPISYRPYWHGAFRHIENALSGDPIATNLVLEYVRKFALVVKASAELTWRDECLELAEQQLSEEGEI